MKLLEHLSVNQCKISEISEVTLTKFLMKAGGGTGRSHYAKKSKK